MSIEQKVEEGRVVECEKCRKEGRLFDEIHYVVFGYKRSKGKNIHSHSRGFFLCPECYKKIVLPLEKEIWEIDLVSRKITLEGSKNETNPDEKTAQRSS